MNFTQRKRTFAPPKRLTKAAWRLAFQRWLKMPNSAEPRIAGRVVGRSWVPLRLCFKESE